MNVLARVSMLPAQLPSRNVFGLGCLHLQGRDNDRLYGLGLLDAHASWHAATVPLTYVFYAFLQEDVNNWLKGMSK